MEDELLEVLDEVLAIKSVNEGMDIFRDISLELWDIRQDYIEFKISKKELKAKRKEIIDKFHIGKTIENERRYKKIS